MGRPHAYAKLRTPYLKGDHFSHIIVALGLFELLQRRIQVVEISLVVLAVVELHDVRADVRFQGGIIIVQIRQLESGQLRLGAEGAQGSSVMEHRGDQL